MANDLEYLKQGIQRFNEEINPGHPATFPLDRDIELEFKVTLKLDERQINVMLFLMKDNGTKDLLGLLIHKLKEELRAMDRRNPYTTGAVDDLTVELIPDPINDILTDEQKSHGYFLKKVGDTYELHDDVMIWGFSFKPTQEQIYDALHEAELPF